MVRSGAWMGWVAKLPLVAMSLVGGVFGVAQAHAADLSGDYLESRTCDIYTGPCFANSEVGLTGNEALLAWSVDQGTFQGTDLSGLKVVLAVHASGTLGFGGGLVVKPDSIRSVVLVDERADAAQQAALVAMVKHFAPRVTQEVVAVRPLAIEFSIDHVQATAKLTAGSELSLATRQLGAQDHCCTNEIVYYPPLAEVENYQPAFTQDARFSGKGLKARWSKPNTRSAFLATFSY